MYIAIDQYGQTYRIQKHPRKELLETLGATQAQKMYIGDNKHIGYVISGLWLSVYTLGDMHQ